jgi:hypothetical protein
MSKKPKRPRDPNQLAKFILDAVTGEIDLPERQSDGKNPAAVALGKLGGLKGGKASVILAEMLAQIKTLNRAVIPPRN